MDAGPLRLRARPTNLVVDAPIVKPTLMPETVKGYLLPLRTRTPSPPPTPTMKPPLVKTTETWPVSAREGVLKPASEATRAAPIANFLIVYFSPFKRHTRPAGTKVLPDRGYRADRSIDPNQRSRTF